MNDVLLIPAVADAHAAYHRERLVGAQRRLFAGGVAGATEKRVFAQVCCYCPEHHPITERDRQILEQNPDAIRSHGMCPEAEARFDEQEVSAWQESIASGGAMSVQDVLDTRAENEADNA